MIDTHAKVSADLTAGRSVPRDGAILGGWAAAVTAVAQAVTIDWSRAVPLDKSGLVVGRDFLNTWMYGRAAWSSAPGRWYDVFAYQAELARLLGPDYPGQNWSYPPTVMLLAAGLGCLPYLPALIAWTTASLAAFVATARRTLRDPLLVFAAAASPAACLALLAGQYSLVATALLLGAATRLDRAPILAGILIGALSLKPQTGLLIPVFLAASGRWRAFGAAAATTLALAGASAALFGLAAWIDFVRLGVPVQNLVLADPEMTGAPFMPTVFMNARLAGLSYGAAMSVQMATAVPAVAALAWFARTRPDADPLLAWTLLLACTAAGTPYLLSYDLLPLTTFALACLARGMLDGRCRVWVRLVFWLPLIQLALGGGLRLPLGGLILPAFAAAFAASLFRPGRDQAAARTSAAAVEGVARPSISSAF